MGLRPEDQEKCVKLWKLASRLDSSPSDWNEEAATYLAAMYGDMRKCSKYMNCVPMPFGDDIAWLLSSVFSAVVNSILNEQKIHNACAVVAVSAWRSKIEAAMCGA